MAAPIRDRLMSRLAHFSFLITRPMTLGVRAVVIDRDEEVLLVRHGYVSGWHFPGGGVEVGETCMEALARELKEEANVALEGAAAAAWRFLQRAPVAPRPCGRVPRPGLPHPRPTRARLGDRGSALFPALGAAGRDVGGLAGEARRDLRFGASFRPLVTDRRPASRPNLTPFL